MTTPVAIITGAGSGIGRAIALRLGRERWRLLLVGRDSARLRETDELLAAGRNVPEGTELLAADLADADSARAVIDAAMAAFGGVDGLVNNAGASRHTSIDEITAEGAAAMFNINTMAPIHLISAAWPVFRRQKRGVVVNISSMSSLDPFPGFLLYSASKSALDGVTRSVAVEGAQIGVTAFSICPGAVETGMLRSLFSKDVFPPERTLDPAGVAELAWECLSGVRGFDNGRSIPLVRRG